MSKYRVRRKKPQDKLADFSGYNNPFPHLREGGSHRDCKLNNPMCSWCNSDWCHRHGQYQRIKDRNKVGAQPDDDWKCWSAVIRFGVDLPAPLAAKCRRTITKSLYDSIHECQWLWRWEWAQWKIHLNLTLLCSPKWERSDLNQHLYKPMFLLGLEGDRRYRTYCLPVKNWEKWHDYLFKTKQKLASCECPPKVEGQRWSYWGMSKGFPVSAASQQQICHSRTK